MKMDGPLFLFCIPASPSKQQGSIVLRKLYLNHRASWIRLNMNGKSTVCTVPDDGSMMDLRIKMGETQLSSRKVLPGKRVDKERCVLETDN